MVYTIGLSYFYCKVCREKTWHVCQKDGKIICLNCFLQDEESIWAINQIEHATRLPCSRCRLICLSGENCPHKVKKEVPVGVSHA